MKKNPGIIRVFFSGDCVGAPGRSVLTRLAPRLADELELDFFVANGENAASGRGITAEIARAMMSSGVDVVTMGDHVWDNKSIFEIFTKTERLVRPANLPASSPGKGSVFYQKNGMGIGVVQVLGRTFVPTLSNCPFEAAMREIEELRKSTPVIIVDIPAEATSEKIAMGWYLDGLVSAVIGTHTHVQTADQKILPKGTAYITDAGMTGPTMSVLGRDVESVLKRFVTGLYAPFSVAEGDVELAGVYVDIDRETGKALSIKRFTRTMTQDEYKR